ncbi:MAG: lectin like domain-containing protein [bacterium]|nr:lectin like domain-containing protein [bacterium]
MKEKVWIFMAGVLVLLFFPFLAWLGDTSVLVPQRYETLPYWEEIVEVRAEAEAVEDLSKSQLPTSYDAREEGHTPEVKDQKRNGECWAYAALSTLEASLLPEYAERFSVEAMVEDKKKNFGDSEEGGNSQISSASLLSWRSPLRLGETEARWHVQEIQMGDKKDLTAIKEAVYLYGAVMASFYSQMTSFDESVGNYRRETAAYFCDSEEKVNHVVVILGWDDNFPKENFAKQPKEDGAFLCLNSWGENFGDGGYFYVSYEDKMIGNSYVFYSKIEKAVEGQTLYETDVRGWDERVGYGTNTLWLRNTYFAQADESLYAVGLYCLEPNQKYQIYAGTSYMELVAEGSFDFKGYTTIPFQKEIEINEGEEFQVRVKLQAELGREVETALSLMSETRNPNARGYISWDGKDWECLEESMQRSLCLKAYAISREE